MWTEIESGTVRIYLIPASFKGKIAYATSLKTNFWKSQN